MSDLEHKHARKEYLGGTGFALFTEVNDRLLETVSNQPLLPAGECIDSTTLASRFNEYSLSEISRAGIGLYLATRSAIHAVPGQPDRKAFYDEHGVSKQDLAQAGQHTFENGFADLGFPWYFPAIVAHTVTDFFVDEGVITSTRKDALSLGDWAGMLRTGWFSKLVHSMAFAPRNMYGTLGNQIADYRTGALATRLARERILPVEQRIFDYTIQPVAEEGYTYAAATLSSVAVRALRSAMEERGNTIGCPVARKSVRLPSGSLQEDAHVKALVADSTLQLSHTRSGDGTIRARQDNTTIDRTLQLFADQLDTYNTQYGMPVVARHRGCTYIEHEQVPMKNLLRWNTHTPVAPTSLASR